MTIPRLALLAILFAPSAARATNVCDFKDCVAEVHTKVGAQAVAIKTHQDNQVRLDGLIAKNDELLKTVDDYSKRIQGLELEVDAAIAKAAQHLAEPKLSAEQRERLRGRLVAWLVDKEDLEDYDRVLVGSQASLQTLHEILPFAQLQPNQISRVEGELKALEALVDTGKKGVDIFAAKLDAQS